jgi:hypothetical protein
MTEWKFMPYFQGEIKTNPTQSEFFTTTEVGNIATALIREGIQNSLDESIYKGLNEKKPIKINIFYSGSKYALQPIEYKKYLNGLIEHLKAEKSGIRNVVDFNSVPMKYLVFEDFKTNGLVGDPNECKDEDVENKKKKHNFYHFWRNIGITGKPEDKLGRWGIGKTVFPVSSRINSFWGITVQKDIFKPILFGQSILKSHNLKNNPKPFGYRPYGFYAKYQSGNDFPFALEDDSIIDDFKKTFRVSRKNNEPGLSLVIPFVRDEINASSIVTSVILQYYVALIKNELTVTIVNEDENIEINTTTLNDVIDKFWEEQNEELPNKSTVFALLEFITWCTQLEISEFINLKEQPISNQPKWSEKLWENIDTDEIIAIFENEGRIAFNVPVKFERENDNSQKPKTCWFKVFFQRDETLKTAETHFIRENITIIDIKSIKNSSIRAMVYIEDKELSNLLGDSENPAHTQWQKDSQNFIDKYIHGDKCISFVVSSIANIFQKLQKPAAGLEKDILNNIFYTPTSGNDITQEGQADDDSAKDDTGIGISVDIPKSKRQMVRINKIPGGIHIYPHGITKDNLPEIELKLAYDTTRGKPLSKYQQLDFILNKLPIKTVQRNCSFSFPETNVVKMTPYNPDFELTITGFDPNRDLFINLKTIYPNNDPEI